MLQLRLLGDFAVEGNTLHIRRLRAQKYAHLLAYLAVKPQQAHPREVLVDLFWPGRELEDGRVCLRTALSSLRRQLEMPDLFMDGPRDSVRINATRIQTDVSRFEEAVAKKDARAFDLYGGEFLPGCYDEWAQDERNRLEAVYESLTLELPGSVPLRSLDSPDRKGAEPTTRQKGVPKPIDRFHGRQSELSQLLALFARKQQRLVTLTGLGGIGKTRLAIEFGMNLPDRVLFLPISEHRSVGSIGLALADALNIDLTHPETLLSRVLDRLEEEPTVIILDNMEQLVGDELAVWVLDLLHRSPEIAMLATSRIPLQVEGEFVFAVLPLNPVDAVHMFIDRARHSIPDYPETAILNDLCARLDRIPLAIELCAAWANVMSSKRMFECLNERFELMRAKKRLSSDRHQSLRAVLEWSCPPDGELRDQLAMLSVLRGQWTLEASEAILGSKAIKALDALMERSLLVNEFVDGDLRFLLLESVRDLVQEFLSEDLRRLARRRHWEYFCEIAVRAADRIRTDPVRAYRTLDLEHPNIVSAIEFGFCSDEETLIATEGVFGRLRFPWKMRGHKGELSKCVSLLSARLADDLSDRAKAVVLVAAGEEAIKTAKVEIAIGYFHQAAEIFSGMGQEGQVASLYQQLAQAHQSQCNWAEAEAAYEHGLRLFPPEQGVDKRYMKAHLANMYLEGMLDPERAERVYRELIDEWRGHVDEVGNAAVLHGSLGRCSILRKDWATAEEHLRIARSYFYDSGQTTRLVAVTRDLATVLRAQNRADEAGQFEEQTEVQ